MKVLFRFSLFLTIYIGVFPISCIIGGCPEPMGYIIEPTSLSIKIQENWESDSSDTIHIHSSAANELYFQIYTDGTQKMVTENIAPSLFFGQIVSASKKCNPDYFIEYVPALNRLEISCDQDLFNHPAGSSLNDEVLLAIYQSVGIKTDTFSLRQYNDSLLTEKSFIFNLERGQGDIRYFFKNNVPKGVFQFRCEMKLEDGSVLEELSPYLSID